MLTEEPEGGYSVRVPALPGCYTQGETVKEALDNAAEAIAGHIAALQDLGEPIPEDVRVQTELVRVAA